MCSLSENKGHITRIGFYGPWFHVTVCDLGKADLFDQTTPQIRQADATRLGAAVTISNALSFSQKKRKSRLQNSVCSSRHKP